MPSARALFVASLLTEPPYGCLGPSDNDRYRKCSLRSQTVGLRKSTAKSRRLFRMNRPPADMFGQALLEDPLLSRGLSYGGFHLRNYCFGALDRGTEFLALPGINRMAVVERVVCGV